MMSENCAGLHTESVGTLESMVSGMARDIESMTERRRITLLILLNKISADKNGLMSSYRYKQISPDDKSKICNGAGAAGRWISSFIPNTLYGLNCIEAFNIHDYDYHVGHRRSDKDTADKRMFDNLITLIDLAGGFLQFFRRRRAMAYYEAVHLGGDEAFFNKG